MSRPIDDDGEYYDRRADPNRADREISLSTATILGIFFGLALVCACFFGFGYTMGHSSARTAALAAAGGPAAGVTAGTAKPAAGSFGVRSAVPAARVAAATTAAQKTAAAQAAGNEQTATVSVPLARSTVAPSDRVIAGDKTPVARVAVPAVGGAQPAGSYMVQVAAVSSQDVADILLGSLEKKGYTVAVHHEPQDKLLHVQMGPFAERKEADAMQKRVLADGFNAIVK